MTVFQLSDVTVWRRRRLVVDISALAFGVGSNVIAGANGSGKSSLLGAMAGLIPWQGKATIEGVHARSRRGRASLGFLPQDASGLDHLATRDAIEYALVLTSDGPRPSDAIPEKVIEELGLGAVAATRIGRLSGGQRRLAYLAMSIAHQPKVLLLDEPTTGLDAEHRSLVRGAIRRLAQSATVISASHLPDDIRELGDRVVVLRKGKPVFDGSSSELARIGLTQMPEATIPLDAAMTYLERGE